MQPYLEFTQIFPRPGWVEHDAREIWATQFGVAAEAMGKLGASAADIAAIGITNQRETTVVWDRGTGEPVCNAIVWQCRRTSEYCDSLKEQGLTESVRRKTGLMIDAYFSATKLKWILSAIPPNCRNRSTKNCAESYQSGLCAGSPGASSPIGTRIWAEDLPYMYSS